MNILVTGGAGYIGSITALELKKAGHHVVLFDQSPIKHADIFQSFIFEQGMIQDQPLLKKILLEHNIEAVIHFAAFIEAGESMQDPGKYFVNNVGGTLSLLDAMVATNIKKLVFSSTAAVYGMPDKLPIPEIAAKKPINPYGESKWMVETMLRWYDQIHDLRSIIIRYFNASGALLDGNLGEDHQPETHLIPNIMYALMAQEAFTIFGNDYPTQDGTCIRDYIHVLDLAKTHMIALEALAQGHRSDQYNAGTGNGYSNQQVVDMVQKVTGRVLTVHFGSRRAGDPAQLVADASKFMHEFGWQPQHSDLKTIVESAWKWHQKNYV